MPRKPPRVHMLKSSISTLQPSIATPRVRDRRVTGWKLQKARERLFRAQPLCVECLAQDPPATRLATQRDHIIPLEDGGRDVDANTQGLCDECHAEKTRREAQTRGG